MPVARYLVRQLQHFQGCTSEAHDRALIKHNEDHLKDDVHPACSSLRHLADRIIQDDCNPYNGRDDFDHISVLHIPATLGSYDHQWSETIQQSFEGCGPAVPDVPDVPLRLCLQAHYEKPQVEKVWSTTFDIDSLHCFPSSLGVAKMGIRWHPQMHPILNMTNDVHLGIRVPVTEPVRPRGRRRRQSQPAETTQPVPLHHIPHYCFGEVIGIERLCIYVFFPRLWSPQCPKESATFINGDLQSLWYDAILAPSLHAVIQDTNTLQYLPASYRVAQISSAALNEMRQMKESVRSQHVVHILARKHLHSLWQEIHRRIDDHPDPQCQLFRGARLYMSNKNTKLQYMEATLEGAVDGWLRHWTEAIDEDFIDETATFVDLL